MSPEEIEQENRSLDFGSALVLLNEAKQRRCSVSLTPGEVVAILHSLECLSAHVNHCKDHHR